MSKVAKINYNEIVEKVQELPISLQIHFIDYLNFLHLKYKKPKLKSFLDPETNEDRTELRRRIKKAKEHPETLVTWDEVMFEIEESFGRKVKIN